jgi:hypothetical protein
MARPERLELPTLWFEAVKAGNLSASCGVAYGRFAAFPRPSIVRKLSVISAFRHLWHSECPVFNPPPRDLVCAGHRDENTPSNTEGADGLQRNVLVHGSNRDAHDADRTLDSATGYITIRPARANGGPPQSDSECTFACQAASC